ncbi:MAG: GldG family protein [Pseudomonadota bacterium]|nr:GldG family protein [Pseudomonadota bacterium]
MTAKAKRARMLAGVAGAILVAAGAAAGIALKADSDWLSPRPASERPELLILTSLPIVFPERFSLDEPQSPPLKALQGRYRVEPISVADARSLKGHGLLLMAQPQAQPAEVLVELDQWVRDGGRLLLLADPMLEWPSERPLGDLLRPPMAFADTGLLGHWGLRLDAPGELGPATFTIGGRIVHALSPGTLVATGPGCEVAASGFVARCRIGRGQATIIADADFIHVEERHEPARSGNLGYLLAELEKLEK